MPDYLAVSERAAMIGAGDDNFTAQQWRNRAEHNCEQNRGLHS
jgi:hypothetical protein